MIKKISKLLSRYKIQRYKLDNESNFKNYIKAIFSSILLTLLILLIPMLLIYNLFILDYLHTFLKVCIVILMPILSLIYNVLFIKVIKNYEPKLEQVEFKHLIIIETTIFSFFLTIITIVVISLI